LPDPGADDAGDEPEGTLKCTSWSTSGPSMRSEGDMVEVTSPRIEGSAARPD
jgi:hypothetical protein